MTIREVPKVYWIGAGIALVGIVYIGLSWYSTYKDAVANRMTGQAIVYHQEGQDLIKQSAANYNTGMIDLNVAHGLRAKIDASSAEIARLKAELAKQPALPPDTRDEIIAEQDVKIVVLESRNEQLEKSALSFKVSAEQAQAAYDKEYKSHQLDNISHDAAISAAKARTFKVGMITLGGGFLIGRLGK